MSGSGAFRRHRKDKQHQSSHQLLPPEDDPSSEYPSYPFIDDISHVRTESGTYHDRLEEAYAQGHSLEAGAVSGTHFGSATSPLASQTFDMSIEDEHHDDASLEVEDEEHEVDQDSVGEGSATPTGSNTDLKKPKTRFRLTHAQTRYLIAEFSHEPHPTLAQREYLSQKIPGLSPRQVQVWFQNRRAKLKRLANEEHERLWRAHERQLRLMDGGPTHLALGAAPPAALPPLMSVHSPSIYAPSHPLASPTSSEGKGGTIQGFYGEELPGMAYLRSASDNPNAYFSSRVSSTHPGYSHDPIQTPGYDVSWETDYRGDSRGNMPSHAGPSSGYDATMLGMAGAPSYTGLTAPPRMEDTAVGLGYGRSAPYSDTYPLSAYADSATTTSQQLGNLRITDPLRQGPSSLDYLYAGLSEPAPNASGAEQQDDSLGDTSGHISARYPGY